MRPPTHVTEPDGLPPDGPRPVLKHPRVARWTHWVSFPLLTVMIWSGLLIYWANDVYRIGWGDWTLVRFFPEWVYATFGLDHRLAVGMAFHYFFGLLFTINGVAYVLWTALSGEWRHLVPDRASWKEAGQVVLHDLKLRKTLPPQGRYNAAQQVTYTAVIAMGAGSVLTGLAIYKPTQLAWLVALFGGYQWARVIHFALMLGYVGFFVIHIAQMVRAGWPNARAMVTGYERPVASGPSPFHVPGGSPNPDDA